VAVDLKFQISHCSLKISTASRVYCFLASSASAVETSEVTICSFIENIANVVRKQMRGKKGIINSFFLKKKGGA